MKRRPWRAGVLLLVCAVSGRTHAQVSPRMEAHVRAEQGRRALREGDATEAVRLFRAALALAPDARVARSLAELLETRGDLRGAVETWTLYSALTTDPGEQLAAEARADRLRTTPSTLRVRVSPLRAAARARIWIDREPPRAAQAGGIESLIEAGPHRVLVESDGFEPYQTFVATSFGEVREVVVTLHARAPDARWSDASVGQ